MFEKANEIIKSFLLIILSFLVFIPSMNGGFLNWDDTMYIINNPLLYEAVSLESYLHLYQYDQHISLVLFSFLLQIKILGTDPVFFHLINSIIHVLNVLLIYKLSRSFSKSVNVSFIIAILWAIHPMKAETVSWMIQRKDLLYSLFFLSSLLVYIRYHKTRNVLFLILSFVFAYLSVLSKIQAFVLPFVFVLTDYYYTSKLRVKSIMLNFTLFVFLFIPIDSLYKSLYLFIPIVLLNLHASFYTFVGKFFPFNKISIVRKTAYRLNSNMTDACFSLYPFFVFYAVISILFLLFGFDFSLINAQNLLYVLMPVFLFVTWCFDFRSQKKTYKIFLIIVASLVLSFILFFVLNKLDGSVLNSDFEFGTRLLFAAYSIVFYLYQLVVPFHLNAMHAYPDVTEKLPLIISLSPIILAIITGFIYFLIKRVGDNILKRQIIFGILFFLLNIALVLHIIPIGGKVLVADRYTYLASFGLIFFMVSLIEYFYRKKYFKFPNLAYKLILLIIILVYAFQTVNRSKLWQDSNTFWSDVIAKDTDNHYARYSLGLYYYEAKQFNKAKALYDSAIKQYDANYEYFANRAAVNYKLKNIDAALSDFEIALELSSSDYASYYNRGVLYIHQKSFVKAKRDFEKALEIKPNYTKAKEKLNEVINIMSVLDDNSKTENLRIPTASKQFNDQGVELAMKGDIQAAIIEFEYAIKCDSLNLNALRNRGNAYAALQMFEKAQNDYLKILSMNPKDSGTYLNLANTYHESGNIDKACEYWMKALEMGENNAQIMLDRFCSSHN